MRRTRIAALAAAGALAVTGSGVALATGPIDDPREREQAVLDDAAKRIGVEPSELRDALREARAAQLDADVDAGRLTEEQADALKELHERDGLVLGGPHVEVHRFRGPLGPHRPGLGLGRGELLERMTEDRAFEPPVPLLP